MVVSAADLGWLKEEYSRVEEMWASHETVYL